MYANCDNVGYLVLLTYHHSRGFAFRCISRSLSYNNNSESRVADKVIFGFVISISNKSNSLTEKKINGYIYYVINN